MTMLSRVVSCSERERRKKAGNYFLVNQKFSILCKGQKNGGRKIEGKRGDGGKEDITMGKFKESQMRGQRFQNGKEACESGKKGTCCSISFSLAAHQGLFLPHSLLTEFSYNISLKLHRTSSSLCIQK